MICLGSNFTPNIALSPSQARESAPEGKITIKEELRKGDPDILQKQYKKPMSAVILGLDGPALSQRERALGLHVRGLSKAPE